MELKNLIMDENLIENTEPKETLDAGCKNALEYLFKTKVEIAALPELDEELASYFAEDDTDLFSNPLLWWRINETRFPRIAKIARRYLTIPASSIPSERVFSTAGNIVSAKRNRLSSSNVDKLIFLAQNWRIILKFI